MDKILVKIPQDIMSLIPPYMESRRRDVEKLDEALKHSDFETMASVGHMMRGSGRGFGFEMLSILGAAIEDAAEAGDAETVRHKLADLRAYLSSVQIVAA